MRSVVDPYTRDEADKRFVRIQPDGTVRIGSSTGYLNIATDGTVTLVGSATTWEDLRVPLSAIKTGAANAPDFAKVRDNGGGSTGVYAYLFDAGTREDVFFACQMPHEWEEGSDLFFHFHWMPTTTGAGTVVWGIEYTWANIDAVMGNTTVAVTGDAAAGVAWTHQMSNQITVTGAGKTSGSMLLCRAYRDAASPGDTYAADAALLEVDFHYAVNSFGEASF